ncbi:MAG TPA: hypothetical protein VN063_07405 [Methylophilaceae bacterium]|nr:hypothetical protein [Methylophilaceae bacterium]
MNRHLYLLADSLDPIPADNLAAVEDLAARGRMDSRLALFEPALAADFGVDAPACAALSWLGTGHDPGATCWMYADPVHLALQRDHFTLAYPAPLRLPDEERETLLLDINRHFVEDGLHFCQSETGDWYLRMDETPRLQTAMLGEALGHDVREFQPQGADAARWKRIQNELQMFLHEHPVNHAREARGLPAVNSLWLWGQGRLTSYTGNAPFTAVVAEHPFARGLAAYTGVTRYPLAALDGDATRDEMLGADALIVMDAHDAACAARVMAMHDALRHRRLRRLKLSIFLRGRLLVTELGPFDAWKLWRRPRPLTGY